MVNFMASKPYDITICRIYDNKLLLFAQPVNFAVGQIIADKFCALFHAIWTETVAGNYMAQGKRTFKSVSINEGLILVQKLIMSGFGVLGKFLNEKFWYIRISMFFSFI